MRFSSRNVRWAAGQMGRIALAPGLPIPVQRRRSEMVAGFLRPPRQARIRAASEGGIRGEWIEYDSPAPRGILLYLHGGGYVLGSPKGHRSMVARLTRACAVRTFSADYRLAPEHPFPCALDDVLAVYRALSASGEPIVVAGDSAGGGLALALAMAVRDAAGEPPAAVAMICPWLDLTAEGARLRGTAPREPLLTPDALARWAEAYTTDATDPLVSPLLGNLAGLPPLVLHSAGDDLLADDADRLTRRAHQQGAHIEHRRYPGRWHAFHLFGGLCGSADEAISDLAAGVRSHLPARRPAL